MGFFLFLYVIDTINSVGPEMDQSASTFHLHRKPDNCKQLPAACLQLNGYHNLYLALSYSIKRFVQTFEY